MSTDLQLYMQMKGKMDHVHAHLERAQAFCVALTEELDKEIEKAGEQAMLMVMAKISSSQEGMRMTGLLTFWEELLEQAGGNSGQPVILSSSLLDSLMVQAEGSLSVVEGVCVTLGLAERVKATYAESAFAKARDKEPAPAQSSIILS